MRAKQKVEPCTCKKTEHFIAQTSYESDGPQGHISRLFFGTSKRCMARACLDRQGDDDIARLKARGLVA